MNYLTPSESLPPGLPREKWWEQFFYLHTISRNVQWAIAEHLIYAKENYCTTPDEWREFKDAVAENTNRAPHTLENYIAVGKKFLPAGVWEELEFGHHEAVAALPEEEREYWLGEATANNWTVGRLRAALHSTPETAQEARSELENHLRMFGIPCHATARTVALRQGDRTLVLYSKSPIEWRVE